MTMSKLFRFPDQLVSRLAKLAQATRRSEAFYVSEVLSYYLDEYADVRIAKDRFMNSASQIISGDELKEMLGV